jgi:hypothetical protein
MSACYLNVLRQGNATADLRTIAHSWGARASTMPRMETRGEPFRREAVR